MKSTLHFFSVLSASSVKRFLLLFFTLFALSVPTWGANIADKTVIYYNAAGLTINSGNKVVLMVGHSTWSQGYTMTKVDGNLYKVEMPSWGGCTQLAFFVTTGDWGGEGKKIDDRRQYATNNGTIGKGTSATYSLTANLSGTAHFSGTSTVKKHSTFNLSNRSFYFDNTNTNFENCYLYIGHNTYTSRVAMSRVLGTQYLYELKNYTWENALAWYVSSEDWGWEGSEESIYKMSYHTDKTCTNIYESAWQSTVNVYPASSSTSSINLCDVITVYTWGSRFAYTTPTVTVTAPTGGSISLVDYDNRAVASGSSVSYLTVLTINAKATSGYEFSKLIIDGTEYNTSSKTITITADTKIEAVFVKTACEKAPEVSLNGAKTATTTNSISAYATATASGTNCHLTATGMTLYSDEDCTQQVSTLTTTEVAASDSEYSLTFTGLTHNTTYWIKAHATTGGGTTYTDAVKVTTDALYDTYAVAGEFNGWSTTANTCQVIQGSNNPCDIVITMPAAQTTYQFKVLKNGTWWGNTGTITNSITNCTFDLTGGSDEQNAKITTKAASDYTFSIYTDQEGKIKVSVTYPECTTLPTLTKPSDVTATTTSIKATATATLTDANCLLTEAGIAIYSDDACTKLVKKTKASTPTSGTAYTVNTTGLTHNTDYWVKAYAISEAGTAYSEEAVSIKTPAINVTYAVAGTFNDWNTTANTCQAIKNDINGCSIDIDLKADTNYEFKIVINGNTWKGNTGSMTRGGESVQTGGWTFDKTGADDNCTLYADIAGTYTFTVFPDGNNYKVTVKYPCNPCITPGSKVYLKPNEDWKKDKARFAANFAAEKDIWVDMTDDDGDGVYECTVPDGCIGVVYLCRMNPNTNTNNWTNKWNNTHGLSGSCGNNLFTVPNGDWDNTTDNGNWSIYVPATAGAYIAATRNITTVCSNDLSRFASLYVYKTGEDDPENEGYELESYKWMYSANGTSWSAYTPDAATEYGVKGKNNNIRTYQTGFYRCDITLSNGPDTKVLQSNVIELTAASDCDASVTDTGNDFPVFYITTTQDFPTCNESYNSVCGEAMKAKRTVDVKMYNKGALCYDRKARMNIRGSSSLNFDKKSYAFVGGKADAKVGGDVKTDELGFFGMPEHKDWVLYAAYADASMLRNALAMQAYATMTGMWSCRTQHVKVYMDGQFAGVYVFMEKPTYGQGRIMVDKNNGYIFGFDKTAVIDRFESDDTSIDAKKNTFLSMYSGRSGINSYDTQFDQRFEIEYPEREKIAFDDDENLVNEQAWTDKVTTLKNRINDFENNLKDGNYKAVCQAIDYQTWADWFIMVEFCKNIDGFRASNWFIIENEGSPIKASPIWDFELSFGNTAPNNSMGESTDGWLHTEDAMHYDAFPIPFWFNGSGSTHGDHKTGTEQVNYTDYGALLKDPCFKQMVKERWAIHTANEGGITQLIEWVNNQSNITKMANLLNAEEARWPAANRNKMGYDAQASWSEQIAVMKEWLPKRRAAMDNLINGWTLGYMQTKIEDSTQNPWKVQTYTTQNGVNVYTFNEGTPGMVLVGYTKATDDPNGEDLEGNIQAATIWKFYPSTETLAENDLDNISPEKWQLLTNEGNYHLPNLTDIHNGYYKVEGPLCGINLQSHYLRIKVNMQCVNKDCDNYYYRVLFTGISASETVITEAQKGNDQGIDLVFNASLPAESSHTNYTIQYKKGATEWSNYGNAVGVAYNSPCLMVTVSGATGTTAPTQLEATHQVCPPDNYWISTPFAGHKGFDGGEQNVQHKSDDLDNNTLHVVDCQGTQGGAQGDFYLYKCMIPENNWNGALASSGVKDSYNNNQEVSTFTDSYNFHNGLKNNVWVRWLFNSKQNKLEVHHVCNIKLEYKDSQNQVHRIDPTNSNSATGVLTFENVDLTNVSGYRIVAEEPHGNGYTQQPWGADYHAPLTNLGTATFTYNYAQNCMTVNYSELILLQIPCSDGGIRFDNQNHVQVKVINAGTKDALEGSYTVTVTNHTTPLTMRGTGTDFAGKALPMGETEIFTSTDKISDDYYITAKLFYNTQLIGTCTLQENCNPTIGDTIKYTVDANLGLTYEDGCTLTFGSLENALTHLKNTPQFIKNGSLLHPVVMEVAYSKTTYQGTRQAGVSAGGDEVAKEVALIIDNINQTDATHPLIIRTSNRDALPWVHHIIIRNARNITLDGLFIVSDVTGKVKDNALEIDINTSRWDIVPTGSVQDAKILIKNSTIGSSGFTGVHASGYDGITFINNNFEAVFDGTDGNSRTWGASAKFIRCKNIQFLRNNFRGDHATLVWLQESTDVLFMNNVFWNTNQYQGKCAAIRLVSQFGLPVNNMAFYYNTLYLANSNLNSYKYDFLRFGQDHQDIGSYPNSYTNIEFMYNNAYSYDTDIAGRNTNEEAFYGIDVTTKFPNFCNNNFWSEYDEKVASTESAFSFGCANQDMTNVRDQLCTTTATGPASLIVRGNSLNKGERPTTAIAQYLGVTDDYTADRYNEKIRPEKVTQEDIDQNNGWTLGAYQMGEERETTTIIWQGVASSDWDDRNNWIDKETGMRLNCLNLLSPDLIAIIPAEFSTQYPRPAEGISNWPKIPENFTTGRTNMDYNEHVSAGLGKVEESKIDLYVKDIVMEFGSGIEGVENLVENAGSNDETRRYNHVTYNFDVERSKWYLVGSVVKKQDANAEGGYRNVISGDYYIANHEPHVYMHESYIDPSTNKATWDKTFADLNIEVPPTKVFAIQVPDEYGPNKRSAKIYYRFDADKSKQLLGDKPWSYSFTGRFVNESAMPVYTDLTINKANLRNNSYPMNIDARVIEEKGLGSVLLYDYEMGSFENIAGDGLIKPQHGFVIQPTEGNSTLTFTPDMLVGGDTKSRSIANEKPLYILKVNKANSTQGYASTIHLVYDEMANGLQPEPLDTRKVYSNSSHVPDVYMLRYDDTYQRLHFGANTTTVPLGIALRTVMPISFEKVSNNGFSQMTLVDTQTGKSYNLLNNDKIIIETSPADTLIEGRFYLNFMVSQDATPDDEVTTSVETITDQQGIQLYVQDGNTISITATNGELQTVYVSDITGRTHTYTVHGTHVKLRPPVANGVYTVRVVGNETSRIEKVILNK